MKGQTILAILAILALVASSVTLIVNVTSPAPKAELIEVAVENSYNDTAIKADLSVVKAEMLEDSDWQSAAIALATVEMEEKDYRNVFNALVALNKSIVDKEDISSVIIRDSDVDTFDVDEKDATVEQELKVYFEDADGNDVKVYLDLTTEIVDNEVDDAVYEVA